MHREAAHMQSRDSCSPPNSTHCALTFSTVRPCLRSRMSARPYSWESLAPHHLLLLLGVPRQTRALKEQPAWPRRQCRQRLAAGFVPRAGCSSICIRRGGCQRSGETLGSICHRSTLREVALLCRAGGRQREKAEESLRTEEVETTRA